MFDQSLVIITTLRGLDMCIIVHHDENAYWSLIIESLKVKIDFLTAKLNDWIFPVDMRYEL